MSAEHKFENDTLHLRLPSELRAILERQASEQHRTLSGHARFLLASAIEAQATKQMETRR
jgi:hypothetical protein